MCLITVYHYNCFIVLLVTVVDLFLCLTYKLNFIMSVYVCTGKNTEYVESVPSAVSGIHWGSPNAAPMDGGTVVGDLAWVPT